MADEKALLKEAQSRLSRAKMERARQEPWMNSGYRFCLPYRSRFNMTQEIPTDQDDLFDSTGQNALADFAAEVTHTFLPASAPWIDIEPLATLDAAAARNVADVAKKIRDVVFQLMRESNLYEAAPESHLDIGIGTGSLIIEDPGPSYPVQCRSVPLPDLWLERGPWGRVGAQIHRTMMTPEMVEATWGKEARDKLPSKLSGKRQEQTEIEIWCAWWQDWTATDAATYRYVVWYESAVLATEERKGRGSCAMITGRWATDPSSAWGIGPTHAALADIRTLDELCYLNLRGIEKRVDPPGFYDDDGSLNVDNGLEAGMFYPRQPGSKVDFLQPDEDMNSGFYEKSELERKIQRTYYQDNPEQLGKTPPTATQWLDQAQRNARRMGSPVGRIVQEWQLPIFDRFAYIATKRGLIKPEHLQILRESAKATSPLLRAQLQDQAMVGVQFLQVLGQVFGPEAVKILVNTLETAEGLKTIMQADVVKLNSKQTIEQIVQGLAAVAAQGQGGAAPGGGG